MQIPTVADRYAPAEIDEYYAAGCCARCWATGCWVTETLGQLLARQACERGDKTFIIDGTLLLTYREVHEQALRRAAGLRARGGPAGARRRRRRPGGGAAANWAEFAVVAAAVARLGAVMVPIMPIYRREEVGHVLDDAGMAGRATGAALGRGGPRRREGAGAV